MTVRLYDTDAYLKEFTACVTGCVPFLEGYAITLDRTAFYPEGGGQPCDFGTLTCEGNTISVTDVQEDEGSLFAKGEILHICSAPLAAGSCIKGTLDWQRRLTHMREHSGEHIISGIICKSHGLHNIGFHMGKDCVTIDFDGLLTAEQIFAAQQKANLKVMENVKIQAQYPDTQTLETLDYRSKKQIDGAVRIVTIPGADVCACCGTHVRSTGEVGPICVTASEHFKNGIRLTILIGEKALADYACKTENIKRISALLSVKPEQTADAVDRLLESNTQLKTAYTGLRLALLDAKADQIPSGSPSAVIFEEELSPMEVRKLADKLQAKADFCAVFSGNDKEGYKYVICSKGMDIISFGKAFNASLNGRGGGKPPMIQGSLPAERKQIESYLAAQHLL